MTSVSSRLVTKGDATFRPAQAVDTAEMWPHQLSGAETAADSEFDHVSIDCNRTRAMISPVTIASTKGPAALEHSGHNDSVEAHDFMS